MPHRLIQVILPSTDTESLRALIEDEVPEYVDLWHYQMDADRLATNVILHADFTEGLLDSIESHYGQDEAFRTLLLDLEAIVPRPPTEEQQDARGEEQQKRLNRQELYDSITEAMQALRVFIPLVVLASVVACVGFIESDVIVVIGAMVISPFLGSIVALALATTFADGHLARDAAGNIAAGIGAALAAAALIALFFPVPTDASLTVSFTQVNIGSVVLALAAGAAGVLSVSTGIPTNVVGVAVSVALLPPLVLSGMLAGSGDWALALDAFILFLANLISINLAGVVTFVIQGVRPNKYYEADKAKKLTRGALTVWSTLLVALIVVIVISQN